MIIYTTKDYRRWTKLRDSNACGALMKQRLERWESINEELKGTGLRLKEMKWDKGSGVGVSFEKEE